MKTWLILIVVLGGAAALFFTRDTTITQGVVGVVVKVGALVAFLYGVIGVQKWLQARKQPSNSLPEL